MAAGNKPRGRPPKIKPLHAVETSPGLTAAALADLDSRVRTLPEVAALHEPEQQALIAELSHAVPFYRVATKARRSSFPSTGGNKPSVHVTNLLIDCAVAWERATGRPGKLWNSATDSSPPVKLTRIALAASHGSVKPFAGDLRRQIESANVLRRVQGR